MKMKLKVMSVLLLLGVSSLFLFSSCVDVPTNAVTPPPALSYYRFLNAAAGAGSLTLSVDGSSIGSLDFKGNTSYTEYPAGTKNVVLSTGDTLVMSMATDYQGTMCILKEGAAFTFLRANELRVFDPVTAEKGKLRVIQLSADAPTLDVTATGPDELDFTGLTYKKISGYLDATPGSYNVLATAGDDTLLNFPVTVGTERSTVFIVGSVAGATLGQVALKDN
jgi:hypothetical protein